MLYHKNHPQKPQQEGADMTETQTTTIFTMKELADCARREAVRRTKVYPRMIEGGTTKRLASRPKASA